MLNKLKEVTKKFDHLFVEHSTKHEDLLKKYDDKSYRFSSVILIVSHLEDADMWDDPKHVKKTPVSLTSRVDRKVYDKLEEKFKFNYDELHFKVAEHFGADYEDKWKEFDRLIASHREALIPEIIEELESEWVFHKHIDEGADEEEICDSDEELIMKDEWLEEWEKYRLECFLPDYTHTHERLFPGLPEPLNSCYTASAQYFFIESDKELLWVNGNYKGSGTRETKGLFSHFFAELQNKGHRIETDVYKVTSKNEIEHLNTFDEFVCDHMDITGNYQIDSEESGAIMKNIRMSSTHYNDGNQTFSLDELDK